ncbi:MAG: AAA family ATPase [Clostridia bacterium]|nr:AAA family ATPase [Clostridia bacterium]
MHVLLTGEIGAGKSTALRRTLERLPGAAAMGLQTYYEEPRGTMERTLYLRAWGDTERGHFITHLPAGKPENCAAVFDGEGCALLHRAQEKAQLIVIDEIGRLERDACLYHKALLACLDADVPVLAVIRKHKAAWADSIRSHPKAALIEVTQENREAVPAQAAALLAQPAGNC